MNTISRRTQGTLFIMSWLLGFFGGDRFYMGQAGLGVLKLFTCGGFGIWSLIDYFIAGMGIMRDVDGNLPTRTVRGTPTRSQANAFLLSVFLGVFGADRFYLGQTGLGLLKLFTCGGLGVWAIADKIIIGCGAMTDVNGNSLAL